MSPLPPARLGGGMLPDHPDLAGIAITEILRDRPEHAVFAVTMNERPYFLKLFRQANAAELVRSTEATLTHAAEALGQAEHAVVRLRLALPEAGVILLDPVHGQQLSPLLAAASIQRRAILISRAGGWLARLTTERETGSFGPNFWLKKLQDHVDKLALPEDRPLLEAHMAEMGRLASTLVGAPVTRAASHGDFTPDNLYMEGARLIGIDMQRREMMAVSRDIARFLVWLQSRRLDMPAVTRHGVSASDYAILTNVPGLIDPQEEPILRFMMGEIMASYFLEAKGKRLRREMLAGAMQRWQQG
ncbi:phosphotransferase [Paracoccus sp. (in: a-proteobacteria)]|uniref:phosphotransferase n=1 Tax=Paracoccus sp. TaxID=267 RepID=UPI0028A1BFA8|nr:phosphotransferase [Paracoccus sp. (in: a-proteobacteria)]